MTENPNEPPNGSGPTGSGPTGPNESEGDVALSASARTLIATARGGDPSPAELAALRQRVLGQVGGGTPPRASPPRVFPRAVAAGGLVVISAALWWLGSSSGGTAPTSPNIVAPRPVDPIAAPEELRPEVREAPPLPLTPPALAAEADEESDEPRDEAAYLESIRVLLDRNPARAARLSHRHDTLFPEGLLAEEAAALEVEALARSGRGDEAREAARRFFSQYPSTPYRLRVGRALAADGESTSTE